MLTMSEKNPNVFISVILFLVLNLQSCYGNYTCYQLSSGKDICFMLDASPRNFEESKTFCKNNGGSLLEIYYEEMEKLVEQFVKSKTSYLGNAWLNLVRTTSNVWVWGDEGSGKNLSYSNFDGGAPASYDGSLNHAFMNSVYKWVNSYDPENASTICIQGSVEPYWLGSETTSTVFTTTSVPTADSTTTKTTTIIKAATITTETLKDTSSYSSAGTTTIAVESSKQTTSVPIGDSETTRLATFNATTTALESPKQNTSVPIGDSETTRLATFNATPIAVESSKQTTSVPTADSTERTTANKATITTSEFPKETASVPTPDSATRTTTIKKEDSTKQITNFITSSTKISATATTATTTTTTTNAIFSQSTKKAFTLTTTTSNTDLNSSSAAGVRVGLGGLVLIIVSSLLIGNFNFKEDISLPFKSSRSRKSPLYETGSDVINDGNEQLDGKTFGERSPYAEVVMILRQTRTSTAMVSKT